MRFDARRLFQTAPIKKGGAVSTPLPPPSRTDPRWSEIGDHLRLSASPHCIRDAKPENPLKPGLHEDSPLETALSARQPDASLAKMATGMTPVIDLEVPLVEFERGLARLESRQVFGKVVVTF